MSGQQRLLTGQHLPCSEDRNRQQELAPLLVLVVEVAGEKGLPVPECPARLEGHNAMRTAVQSGVGPSEQVVGLTVPIYRLGTSW